MNPIEFTSEQKQALVDLLLTSEAFTGSVALKAEVNGLAADMKNVRKAAEAMAQQMINRAIERVRDGRAPVYRHSAAIRGAMAMRGVLDEKDSNRESDVNYLQKTLVTGSTPGSYLVPTIQAAEAIDFLSLGGVLRQMGARVWPMNGIQKMNVPVATAAPTVAYAAQTDQTSPSDPNLSQVSFDLKERRTLVAIPRLLLKAASPAVDSLIEELIVAAFAEHEDKAAFSTSALSGGPTTIYAASGTTTHLVGESANGGNLAYSDLVRTLRKSAAAKAKAPFAWGMSPRTFFDRIIGMVDTTNQPVFQKDPSGKVIGTVLGYPVFVSPEIPENQTNGSGTNQSYLVFTNPRYLHIGDGGSLEIALSEERFFDYNQIAIRGVHAHDFGYGPAAGIVILKGIN